MSERVARFIQSYAQGFPSSVNFQSRPGEYVQATSSHRFSMSRASLIEDLLNGQQRHEVMAQALLAEQIVHLSLEPLLEPTGFYSCLAPQTLELSQDGQKGIDLILSGPHRLAYLGIDIKLRQGRSPWDRDGYGWNQNLCFPYIYLSLGNCFFDMRDNSSVPLRQWLKSYAIPQIPQSGKIPGLHEFRNYLVCRIEKSLQAYTDRLVDPPPNFPDYGIPPTSAQTEILLEKLAVIHSLFTELRLSI